MKQYTNTQIAKVVKYIIENVETLNNALYIIENVETLNDALDDALRVKEIEQQNERYREALEFYANKINYLTFIENGKSNIEHDQGEKARQALKGEK